MLGWIRRELKGIAEEQERDDRLVAEVWEVAVSIDGASDLSVRVTGIPGRFPVYAESRAKLMAEEFGQDGVWDADSRVFYPPARVTGVSIRKIRNGGDEASGSAS